MLLLSCSTTPKGQCLDSTSLHSVPQARPSQLSFPHQRAAPGEHSSWLHSFEIPDPAATHAAHARFSVRLDEASPAGTTAALGDR